MIQLFDLPELLTLKSSYSLHCDLEFSPSQPLVDSVRRFGLFQPPVLMQQGSSLHLVCGSRRIKALQLAGLDRGIACTVVENREPVDLLSLILENQLLTGPLSPINGNNPQTWLTVAPVASSVVTLRFFVSADVDASFERVDVFLNGTQVGVADGAFCADPPTESVIVFDGAVFNVLVGQRR